ncbi:hypothetical protein ALTERO38_90212 [Alteromonas sp. 38]|nr:hypothetical protein ALTER154_10236 [Alteromonas sp. 154]VXC51765.1 hypothetical protein ALTERO38_90212 [Alteromonas sp. 38]
MDSGIGIFDSFNTMIFTRFSSRPGSTRMTSFIDEQAILFTYA